MERWDIYILAAHYVQKQGKHGVPESKLKQYLKTFALSDHAIHHTIHQMCNKRFLRHNRTTKWIVISEALKIDR